jgi:hypothetical protein
MMFFFRRFFSPFDMGGKSYASPDAPSGGAPAVDAPPVDDTPPAKVDTPTEPSGDTPDTPDDTPSDTTDYGTIMQDTGLHSKYGSVEAALRAIPEQQAAITRSQQEAAELRRLLTQMAGRKEEPAKPELSDEEYLSEFNQRPQETLAKTLDRLGYAKKTDVENLSQTQKVQVYRTQVNEFADTLATFPELSDVATHARRSLTSQNPTPFPRGKNKIWDDMMALAEETGNNSDSALPLLYRAIKGGARPTAQPPVSADKKLRAKTAGGGAQPGRDDSVPNFADRSKFPTAESIKKWAREHNQVAD